MAVIVVHCYIVFVIAAAAPQSVPPVMAASAPAAPPANPYGASAPG